MRADLDAVRAAERVNALLQRQLALLLAIHLASAPRARTSEISAVTDCISRARSAARRSGGNAGAAQFFVQEIKQQRLIHAVLEPLDRLVHRGAALARPDRRADRRQNFQAQDAPRIDGVRIADQCFDLRDADPLEPRMRGRLGLRRFRETRRLRRIERARPMQRRLRRRAARAPRPSPMSAAATASATPMSARHRGAAPASAPPAAHWRAARNRAPPGQCADRAKASPSIARMARDRNGSSGGGAGHTPSFSPPRIIRSRRCKRASSGPQIAIRASPPEGRSASLPSINPETRAAPRAASIAPSSSPCAIASLQQLATMSRRRSPPTKRRPPH